MDTQTVLRLRDYLDGLKQRDLEMAIVMDATASMIPMVNEARAAADGLIVFIQDLSKSFRLAFIAYRDHDNLPVWDGVPLTADVLRIRRYLFDLRITGGADLPEAVDEGIGACMQLDWSPAAHKQVILIGDARPHPEDSYQINELLTAMLDRQIVIHAVHIPMRIENARRQMLSERDLQEIDDHNTMTATAFQEIAETGGGRMVHLDKAADLVPAIMRFTIDETWWDVFDEFYNTYLNVCR
jgi:Mg-chelatase subunit ChlD